MSNKRSSVKKIMCVLCASLQSIVGTSLARDKKVNYQGTKFQFLRNMGGVPVKQKKEKGFVEGAIETVTNHPIASAASVLIGGDILVKGGELAWKRGIQPFYLKWFGFPEYYGYLYNCFNLAYGRISKIFAVCNKNSNLCTGVGRVLKKLCGENGAYNSETGVLVADHEDRRLSNVNLEDGNQLDGALLLLSEIFPTGEMKNNEYYYDVMQNLKKIFPGCSEHDSYKKIGGVENLDPRKISSRSVVLNAERGWFSRFAAGYGKFKQNLPFNPFPLIYLIRRYILASCLPEVGGFTNLVNCNLVKFSDTNPFVKNYGLNGQVHDGNDVVNENYLSLSRTGDKLTIAFWLTNGEIGNLQNGNEAKRVECTYTIPTVPSDKNGDISTFDKRWKRPEFVNDRPLQYDGVSGKFI